MKFVRLHFVIAAALLAPQPVIAREVPFAPQVQAPSRFIVMEGGRNFRDVGGYRTADGRTVRWHALYRTGSLANLTPEAIARFGRLHVTLIIDLRSSDERARDPGQWQQQGRYGYWARDYSLGQVDMARLMADPAMRTPEGIRGMMIQGYRTLPKQLAPSYRELFTRLAAPHRGAVVVNCTAGKDRTGIATALVLTALGVPYATVREDFLLSNGAPGMDNLRRDLSAPSAALPPDLMKPLAGVEGAYIDATFDQLRKDYGSVERYLQTELGVGPRQIAALRRNLLTR
ncbi:MAG: tyrosine-protein phosphatase [Novosphingobium sp.]